MKNNAYITYKDAGVDIDKARCFVKSVERLTKKFLRPEVITGIGGFSALFKADFKRIKKPVLAASTDGVGTKLLVANIVGKYDTVGIDLVAMCANDIVTCGAEPLFFLDYFATGKLDVPKMSEVIKGIHRGCREAGCSLIGGETAELPGLYRNGEYDIAGFCVGVVNRDDIIDGSRIEVGDVVLGVSSSGPHSNGYSLIRKIFSKSEIRNKFKEILLKPTKIYVKPILSLIKRIKINGIAHITGGGFYENIKRLLPNQRAVVLNSRSWRIPSIFRIIQERTRLPKEEMFKTFNMGIGMVLILKRKDVTRAVSILKSFGHRTFIIGEVARGRRQVII